MPTSPGCGLARYRKSKSNIATPKEHGPKQGTGKIGDTCLHPYGMA